MATSGPEKPVKRAVCSWSGGKDSCYALIQAKAQGMDVRVLMNAQFEGDKDGTPMGHGVPTKIIQRQAEALRLPMVSFTSKWGEYEKLFLQAMQQMKDQYEISHAVFGDIDLQAHRDWEETTLQKVQLQVELPLWNRNRKELALEMVGGDKPIIETMIVSCNEAMGERFLGHMLTAALIQEIEQVGADPCGEDGEFHTLVLNCPLFTKRLDVKVVDKVKHGNYWFCVFE